MTDTATTEEKPKIMKCIVEALVPVALQCPNGDDITYGRPSLVIMDWFVDQAIFRKQVRVLAMNLPEDASQDEWKLHRKAAKGDTKLAVDSFCALYKIDSMGQPIESEV